MTKPDGQEQDQVKLPAFFDEHPTVKAKLEEYLKTVPPEQKKANVEQFKKFIAGEITWGEIRGITRRMQKELARVAYLKFQLKDFNKAESIFKGLAIVDHTNWYYRAALGAVYQKQGKYDDAIDEYDVAIQIKENEWSCQVNRGECLMMTKDFDGARKDFEALLHKNLPSNNPWLIRARALIRRLDLISREDNHDK